MKNGLGNDTMSVLSDLLSQVRTVKQAAVKSAVGETSHPVAKADDGTVAAPEGARAKENTSDIKKNVGAGGVTGQEDANSAPEVSTKGTHEMQPSSSDEGLKGNIPDPKAAPKKPGEGGLGDASAGHPSNQTFEEKFSAVRELGNKIAADIAMFANAAKKEEPKVEVEAPKAEKKTKKEEKKAEVAPVVKPEVKKAEVLSKLNSFLSGYKAAETLDNAAQAQVQFGKEAAAEVSGQIVKEAEAHAEAYCEFLRGYMETKQANAKPQEKKAEQIKLSAEQKFQVGYAIGESLKKEAAAGTLTTEKLEAALKKLAEETGEVVAPEELAAMVGGQGAAPVPEAAPVTPEADPQLLALAKELAEAGVQPEELIAALEGTEGAAPAPEAAPEVAAEAAKEGEPVAQEAKEKAVE